jgi:ATP-dependent DNA helicase RecQ
MSPNLRKSVQEQFTRGDVRCIVATSAFGMGIDVPDVRLVANWQLPASLFDLAQQGGRASRDGEPAVCWTNLGTDAEKIQRYFLLLGNPPWRVYRKLWDAFSRNTGNQRWRGDILLRVAGVGEKMSGQLSAALSYLEFRRQIRTVPAGEVYVLPIRDPVRAARLASTVSGARVDKDNVIYSVSRGTVDHSKVFTANGACYGTEPVESVVVTRLVDELQITPDDIADREARAEDNLEAIYEFAKAEDKKAYLESVMSK